MRCVRAIAVFSVALVLLQNPSLEAQEILSVDGTTAEVAIKAGTDVAPSVTGRVYRWDKTKVYVAEFSVVAVKQDHVVVQLTKQIEPVVSGMLVEFDAKRIPTSSQVDTPKLMPRLSAEELLTRANRLFDAKDWIAAKQAFEDFLKQYPGHPDADYAKRLAILAERNEVPSGGNDAKSQALVDKLGEILGAARAALTEKRFSDAVDLVAMALSIDPSNAEARTIRRSLESHEKEEQMRESSGSRDADDIAAKGAQRFSTTLRLNVSVAWREDDKGPSEATSCALFDQGETNICQTPLIRGGQPSGTAECEIGGLPRLVILRCHNWSIQGSGFGRRWAQHFSTRPKDLWVEAGGPPGRTLDVMVRRKWVRVELVSANLH